MWMGEDSKINPANPDMRYNNKCRVFEWLSDYVVDVVSLSTFVLYKNKLAETPLNFIINFNIPNNN